MWIWDSGGLYHVSCTDGIFPISLAFKLQWFAFWFYVPWLLHTANQVLGLFSGQSEKLWQYPSSQGELLCLFYSTHLAFRVFYLITFTIWKAPCIQGN
jgi:hypothetical protein